MPDEFNYDFCLTLDRVLKARASALHVADHVRLGLGEAVAQRRAVSLLYAAVAGRFLEQLTVVKYIHPIVKSPEL